MGYPQSPPELRQELIAEQFVRGQSDPELKKYLWVMIRAQKERKLQTLIEVCTDFSSLVSPTHLQCINRRILIQKRSRIKMTSSRWATVQHGIKELRTHPHLLASGLGSIIIVIRNCVINYNYNVIVIVIVIEYFVLA